MTCPELSSGDPPRRKHREGPLPATLNGALGAGDGAGAAGVDAGGEAEGAGERLEDRLGAVVVVAAGEQADVQGDAGVLGERPEEVLDHLRGQAADALAGEGHIYHNE